MSALSRLSKVFKQPSTVRIRRVVLRLSIVSMFCFSSLAAATPPTHSATPAGIAPADWNAIYDLIATQNGYIKASNIDLFDEFGSAVAIDGNTLVVGVPDEDSNGSDPSDNSAENVGAVYVFVRENNDWTQQAYLKASNAEADDEFGRSVALNGNTLVVGAPGEAGNGSDPSDNSATFAGAAYVFVRDSVGSPGQWTEQAYLKAANAEAQDAFGSAVALAGDTIVAGAHGEDSNGSDPSDNSATFAGAAYVFTRVNGTWNQQAYLKASNADTNDEFGIAVALDGSTLALGASGESSDGSDPSDNSALLAGAAYVFVRENNDWTQQAYLKASNVNEFDWFGSAVAVDGEMIVVGAPGEDSNGSTANDNTATNAGAVYSFMLAPAPLLEFQVYLPMLSKTPATQR